MKIIDNELYDIDSIDIKNGVLTIPNGIVNIKDSVVIKNKKVVKINFSKSVKRIYKSIFKCPTLKELNFESSLFKIYGNDFSDFPKLKKITIYNQELISKDAYNSYEQYLKIMNTEIFDTIYNNINRIDARIDKQEFLNFIKKSDTICNYINDIIYDILNNDSYDFEEDIRLLCMAIIDVTYINQGKNIKLYEKIK